MCVGTFTIGEMSKKYWRVASEVSQCLSKAYNMDSTLKLPRTEVMRVWTRSPRVVSRSEVIIEMFLQEIIRLLTADASISVKSDAITELD